MTAPLARVAAQFRNDLPSPYRRYTMGPVWRNEKPGPGRFRQFYQCDADTVGSASVAADAEICAMLADTLEAVGIPRGDYIVRVNNRKVLNGVLEVAGLSSEDKEHERGIVLQGHRQARQVRAGGRAAPARQGPDGRERGFHGRRGAE
jgi:histidyl-tRNA synthetase